MSKMSPLLQRGDHWPPIQAQVYQASPNAKLGITIAASKKGTKSFFTVVHGITTVERAKREQKRLNSWLSASVSDHHVTSSDHVSYLRCSITNYHHAQFRRKNFIQTWSSFCTYDPFSLCPKSKSNVMYLNLTSFSLIAWIDKGSYFKKL